MNNIFENDGPTREKWGTGLTQNKYVMWGGIAVAAYVVLKWLKIIR